MNSIIQLVPPELRKQCVQRTQPSFVHPMLATLTEDYFSRDDWIYEKKLDGIRLLAFKKDGKVRLVSRNNTLYNTEFPTIVKALEKYTENTFILDGEIVAVGKKGVSDFQLLQQRKRTEDIKLVYYVFDMLFIDGYDIRKLPLVLRKKLLKKTIRSNTSVVYTQETTKKGIAFFNYACQHGWEGVMAKYAYSPYLCKRSTHWLKFKCVQRQELVIGGYTQPHGVRSYFGALLVGYYEQGKLRYAGKVGTGYSQETLEILGKKLQKLASNRCPFVDYTLSERTVQWVKPVLVAEIGFAQWTKSGKLRVARFKGLRTDKRARDVIREKPKHVRGRMPRAKNLL